MLIINEEDLVDIKSLANANPAAMLRVVAMLDKNFKEIDETLNHLDPNPDDFNFNIRFHHRRGFAACLDTLRNVFRSPDEAMPKEEKKEEAVDNAF